MTTITVTGQGHAPLLRDALSIEAIRGFLSATETGTHRVATPTPERRTSVLK